MRIITLLSPAKTLSWAPAPASLTELWTQPKLLTEADPVIEVMKGKSKAALKGLFSVSDNIADLNHGRFKKFLFSGNVQDGLADAAAAESFRPSALAYDGPAYRGLDAKAFSEEDWAFGGGSVRLLSGLYGVLRPTDLIQPYRLEMGSRVGVSRKKDLYAYWKEIITNSLLEDLGHVPPDSSSRKASSVEGSLGSFLVVNVASQEYSKAVDFGALEEAGGKVVTCTFKDDGRVLSVFAKRARGLFARHVVCCRAESMADLEAFSAEGYRLDRSQCRDGLLVFTRSKAQRVSPQISATAPVATATATATRGRKRVAPAAKPEKAVGTGSAHRKR